MIPIAPPPIPLVAPTFLEFLLNAFPLVEGMIRSLRPRWLAGSRVWIRVGVVDFFGALGTLSAAASSGVWRPPERPAPKNQRDLEDGCAFGSGREWVFGLLNGGSSTGDAPLWRA